MIKEKYNCVTEYISSLLRNPVVFYYKRAGAVNTPQSWPAGEGKVGRPRQGIWASRFVGWWVSGRGISVFVGGEVLIAVFPA